MAEPRTVIIDNRMAVQRVVFIDRTNLLNEEKLVTQLNLLEHALEGDDPTDSLTNVSVDDGILTVDLPRTKVWKLPFVPPTLWQRFRNWVRRTPFIEPTMAVNLETGVVGFGPGQPPSIVKVRFDRVNYNRRTAPACN